MWLYIRVRHSRPKKKNRRPTMYRHLTLDNREVIQKMYDQGYKQIDIAKKLDVSTSTISRELNRTQTGYYYARLAHNQAQEKRKKANGLRSKRYNQRLVSHWMVQK